VITAKSFFRDFSQRVSVLSYNFHSSPEMAERIRTFFQVDRRLHMNLMSWTFCSIGRLISRFSFSRVEDMMISPL
jgi:hypothetical protein